MVAPLLEVRHLVTSFTSQGRRLVAVDDVSFSVEQGQTLALVGESGCGKSVTAQSLLGLLPSPPGRIESGQILFEGEDLLRLPAARLRQIRGNRVAMIFQEPMTSLNPVYCIGSQIAEAILLHRGGTRRAARTRTIELLEAVGIPAPEERIDDYPHQLSGGMRQRVMIAMALCCEPRLLIADEPTTALDVTIQAQILDLLLSLQKSTGMGILFITHDLGIVAQFAQRVAVMYAGRIVEAASVEALFDRGRHPYTRGLLASIPARALASGPAPSRLPTIEGTVPSLAELPRGCRFSTRCEHRRHLHTEQALRCTDTEPSITEACHAVRCHFPLAQHEESL
jgi:oligopeptide/dipeptide ABC transporter ATP-binding protein